ncbi:MAG: TolC family protein [Candidatus Hinthialibacter antarcticus]|nr:TolC family protein [Candidatus Hinthialibacter antarcticus]
MQKHLIAAVVLLSLTSCAVHQVHEDVPVSFIVPDEFRAEGEAAAPDRWWESFDDSALQNLIDEGLSKNLTLRQAWARLAQARAIWTQASTELFPQATLDLGATRFRNEVGNAANVSGNYSASIITSYEVDLWKRIDSQQRAAELDIQASRSDIEATALSLSASIASVWYSIIEQQAKLTLLNEQIEVSKTFLELIELRFSQGRTSAVEVYQQRAQLAAIDVEVPGAESLLRVYENQLAVLLGEPPMRFTVDEPKAFPELDAPPAAGAPAALLLRRPDIRAALTRVYAADYRIGAAIADQYPALRLSAQSEFRNNDLADLFQNWLLNLASNLTTPILDGGRRKAEIERTRAVKDERIAAFEQSMLIAFQEVENAWTQEDRQRELIKRLQHELEQDRSAFEESRNRFRQGIGEYLSVLTSLQSMQRVERTLISAQRNLIGFRIDLYAALGGDWMSELQPPDPAARPDNEENDS